MSCIGFVLSRFCLSRFRLSRFRLSRFRPGTKLSLTDSTLFISLADSGFYFDQEKHISQGVEPYGELLVLSWWLRLLASNAVQYKYQYSISLFPSPVLPVSLLPSPQKPASGYGTTCCLYALLLDISTYMCQRYPLLQRLEFILK